MSDINSHPLQLEFIDSHSPGMPDGDYRITVQQALSVSDSSNELSAEDATRYLYVSVAGPRFSLDPGLVKSVFPPDKGIGRYTQVLPHIVFNRSTLPWERQIDPASEYAGVTWLALLMFTEDEVNTYSIQSQSMTLEQLQPGSTNPQFPTFALESAQTSNDQTLVIDVPWGLLKTLIPSLNDLKLLAHVRELSVAGGESTSGEDNLFPILVGNRLPVNEEPPAGREVTVYLVSLEGRTDIFDSLNAGSAVSDESVYRLVTLNTWRYATLPENKTFSDYIVAACHPQNTTNTSNVLRLDLAQGDDVQSTELANQLLGAGYVPLPHQTRQGNQLISWYRSPLVPGVVEDTPNPDEFTGLRSADQLVRYFSQVGMLDTTYAAAWQLGQLLTLQNTSVSVALYNWKRAQVLANANQTQQPKDYLPFHHDLSASPLPDVVMTWLNELALFEHTPFNYLAPSEGMLPSESIRFFTVDPLWRAALLDGAFSVGRVLTADAERDKQHLDPIQRGFGGTIVSGFLLRSHVVEGWPHMQVAAYSNLPSDGDLISINLLRMERLAPDILLCMFAGNMQTLDLHEVPETIHFGVGYDPSNELYMPCDSNQTPSGWYKSYRFPATAAEYDQCSVDLAPYLDLSTGVLQIQPLAQALQDLGLQVDTNPVTDGAAHSWWVAFQMIEGVQQVRLLVGI